MKNLLILDVMLLPWWVAWLFLTAAIFVGVVLALRVTANKGGSNG